MLLPRELALPSCPLSKNRTASSCRFLSAVSLALAAVSCGGAPSRDVARRGQGVVYGDDDRKEPFASQPPAWLAEVVRTRLLALGDSAQLSRLPSGEVRVDAQTLQERYALCADQAFVEQPSFAFCSGVLMSSRYALTAAHCTRALQLSEQVGLSRFYNDASGALSALENADLHTFARVVAHDDYWDYAWLELREPISSLAPITTAAIATDDSIVSVHHSAGLPAKVTGSNAASVDQASFLSTLDAFGGASGGPVFSTAGELLGILSAGAPDYEMTASGCQKAAQHSDRADSASELALRAEFALQGLCKESADPELCSSVHSALTDSGCAIGSSRVTRDSSASSSCAIAALLVFGVRRRRRG